jgi:hypothetical protein
MGETMRKFMIAVAIAVALFVGGQASAASPDIAAVPLPENIGSVQIIKPDTSVPVPYARFVDVWTARFFFESQPYMYTLIIRSVSAQGYVTGLLLGTYPKPWSMYLVGKIEDGTLKWRNPVTGSYFTFVLNSENSMSLTYLAGKSSFPDHFTLNRVPEVAWPKGVSASEPLANQTH